MDLTGLRAFLYDRSSRLGRRDGASTLDQRTDNRRWCEQQGMIVVGEFSDPGRSASRYATKARDDWDEMIAQARAGGCDVIVYWEASRATRNMRTYLDLRDMCEGAGVLLCYQGRAHNMNNRGDRFMTGLDVLRAEEEADAIRERNLRTTRLNAERGGVHGRLAYGFRREYDPEKGKLLRQVVFEPEARVIREAAAAVTAGKSLRSIAARFEERGVPTPGGGVGWESTTVRQLLLRESLIGKRAHNGTVVADGVWDAILEPEVYYACVKILRDPERLNHKDTAVKHLMAGIGWCGQCREGRLYVVTMGSGLSYRCRVCLKGSMRKELLEAAVQAALLAYVERPEFAAALEVPVDDPASVGVASRLAGLEAQLAESTRLASTWDPVLGRFALSAARLAALEAQLLPQIEAARASIVDRTVPAVVRDMAGPGAREVWKRYDLAQRRATIRGVVKVYLNRGQRGVGAVTPGRFTWEWLR
jgi:site-specific DNA recombinase